MKINEVLNNWDERNKEILSSEDNLMNILEQNCSESLQALKQGITVYKGFQTYLGEFVKINPKLKERKSMYTSNYYNLLMSNLPCWQDYPKRNRSLICTNNPDGIFYTNRYLVLPKNNANFGICPDYDIQVCALNKTNIKLCHFNELLQRFGIHEFSYNNLINDIFKKKDKFLGSDREHTQFYDKFYGCESSKDVIKVLEYFLDPMALGFKVGEIDSVPISGMHEVWTDSESYLIDLNSNLYKKLQRYL